ncbi:MAG: sulfotransferase family 2 domain-containing protein [Microcoleaceae cyanobacterium]
MVNQQQNLSPAQTLIFLHIPKTAGTTLHQIIDRHYSIDRIFWVHATEVNESINEFKSFSEEKRRNFQLIKGHMGFGLHQFVPQPCTYFTLLRDPVKRIISHYYHVLRTPNHYLHQVVTEQQMDLKAFVSSGISLELDNGQTRLIAASNGNEDESIEFGCATPELLETAKQHLINHFSVVGVMEEFDRTLLLLQKKLGWKNICYARQNTSKNKAKKSEISAETLAAIQQQNTLDIELYQFAKQLLNQQVQAQSATFEQELLAFQAMNQSYGSFHGLAWSTINKARRAVAAIR